MGFAEDIAAFTAKLKLRTQTVFINSASAVKESVVNGSALTGAPGQPVGQYGPGYHPGEVGGELKASWHLTFESPTVAVISTNSKYAPANEYGIRSDGGPYNQRSSVGGRHSVALTIASGTRLVEAEVRKVTG